MNDEDDVVMMSLTDALTCVLAASIALFLIFVVFVKLVPSASSSASGSAASRMNAAVNADLESGDSTALLRIQSSDCDFVKTIGLHPPESEAWLITQVAGEARGCARLLHLKDGLRQPIHAIGKSVPRGPVTIHLEVGSESWPPNAAQPLDANRFVPCANGSLALARIENRTAEYFGPPTAQGCP